MAVCLSRKNVARYSELLKDLSDQIASGKLKEDDCLFPEVELCRMYNLSRKSVRKALSRLEARGLLRRVPGRGTFVRARPVIGTIACVFRAFEPGTSDDAYFFEIFSAAAKAISRKGFKLLSCTLDDERDVVAHVLPADDLRAILIDERTSDADLARMQNLGVPIVLVYRTPPDNAVSYVVPDNAGGATRLIDYLVSIGHKRIAYIYDELSCNNQSNFIERLQGHKAALRSHGIKPNPRLVRVVKGDNIADGYAQEAQRVLRLKRAPTAIFAANDRVAPHVMRGIRDAGKRIPEDVSLVGFADKEIAAQLSPPLTTVKVFTAEMGEAAARILFDALEGKETRTQQVRTRTELVIRRSCAPVLETV